MTEPTTDLPAGTTPPAPDRPDTAARPAGPVWRGRISQQVQQALAFATLVALIIFFSLASPNFLTVSNIGSILLATAVIGILAVGTTFVIITGGIDLSI
ncbi:MAG TPA: ABC transporter permease, partial [Brevibacterium sp.]|nr:ABC transporter permease [Brevibacterium sp.]